MYARDEENIARLARALELLDPYLRGAPKGRCEQLAAGAQTLRVFGVDVEVVTLEQRIHLKRAAGRPKDLEALAELEALADEQHRTD